MLASLARWYTRHFGPIAVTALLLSFGLMGAVAGMGTAFAQEIGPGAGFDSILTTIAAWSGVLFGVLALVKAIAAHTQATWDDELVAQIESVAHTVFDKRVSAIAAVASAPAKPVV